jgi:hypothetical protein
MKNNVVVDTAQYGSLEEMNEKLLGCLNFDDLVYVSEVQKTNALRGMSSRKTTCEVEPD